VLKVGKDQAFWCHP